MAKLKDFVMTGEPVTAALGPWPKWYCEGDLWSYGESMEDVRRHAIEAGIYKPHRLTSERDM